jgi:2-polyprenyl-6-methoxyphenol hydroxylase-like FAD-dependent oxidoreductase
VEGSRWLVKLAGVHDDVPGTTADEVLAFARSLLTPAVAQFVEHAGPLSSVASYRFPSSQRRHYENIPRLLPGFVTLGDAACSFNPIYGQGMACAALQAEALGDTVRAVGLGSEQLPRRFHRRAARVIDAPWAIAVGADFLHPKTVGPKARGTDPVNRYVLRVVRASHTSVPIARSFNLVLNLVKPVSTLARPSVVAGVLVSTVHRRRRQARLNHPRVGSPPTA